MKAEFREYDSSFSIELTPETTEEVLRAARLGLTSRNGARVHIFFGEANARVSLSFTKHKNKYPSIQK